MPKHYLKLPQNEGQTWLCHSRQIHKFAHIKDLFLYWVNLGQTQMHAGKQYQHQTANLFP